MKNESQVLDILLRTIRVRSGGHGVRREQAIQMAPNTENAFDFLSGCTDCTDKFNGNVSSAS